jgi:hypothetical protein
LQEQASDIELKPNAPLSSLSYSSTLLSLPFLPCSLIAKTISMAYMTQFVNRNAMEVAPSKLPSMVSRGRLPVTLGTIKEDDREAMVESPMAQSCSHKAKRGMEADTSLYCADQLAFLSSMAKTRCHTICRKRVHFSIWWVPS